MSVKRRLIRQRVRRSGRKDLKLEINSLLDILVILLVFLIKSYSSQDVVINIPKNISVPLSRSQSPANQAIIVQMSSDEKVWVDNELFADLRKDSLNFRGTEGFPGLQDNLSAKRRGISRVNRIASGLPKSDQMVNLIMDKSLPYDFIRRIMHSATEAGFSQFKFIVIGSD